MTLEHGFMALSLVLFHHFGFMSLEPSLHSSSDPKEVAAVCRNEEKVEVCRLSSRTFCLLVCLFVCLFVCLNTINNPDVAFTEPQRLSQCALNLF